MSIIWISNFVCSLFSSSGQLFFPNICFFCQIQRQLKHSFATQFHDEKETKFRSKKSETFFSLYMFFCVTQFFHFFIFLSFPLFRGFCNLDGKGSKADIVLALFLFDFFFFFSFSFCYFFANVWQRAMSFWTFYFLFSFCFCFFAKKLWKVNLFFCFLLSFSFCFSQRKVWKRRGFWPT